MIHYIYRIDFLCGEQGRYYIGKHSFRYANIEKSSYAGSGSFCKRYYKKYGKILNKTYKKTIIEINDTFEINRKRELEIIGDLWYTDPLCVNMCPGGGKVFPRKRPVVQYDLQGNFIAQYDSIIAAEKELNLTTVLDCCSGRSITSGGYVWRYENDPFDKFEITKHPGQHKNKKRKVNQYTVDGKFIKTWNFAEDAALELGNTLDTTVLYRCAKHIDKCYTWMGYRWEYFNGSTDDIPPLKVKIKRPIYQYDMNDNFIAMYRSCEAGARATGHRHTEGIKRCAEGLQKSSYGYKWKYIKV